MLPVPKAIPRTPGVYKFLSGAKIIYVGKAANLKARLSSYWRKNATDKAKALVKEATLIEWIETASEVEALLKEAELIKSRRPKYNALMKDDKNYSYVAFTKGDFPRIFVTHQPTGKSKSISNFMLRASNFRHIGPFTNGGALKIVLKLLRRVFPYCTCRRPHQGKCLMSQLGLCPGYCCDKKLQISNLKFKTEYRKTIKNIAAVLTGRSKKLLNWLKREMKTASRAREFERAARLRDQVSGIENILSHRRFLEKKPEQPWSKIERVLLALVGGSTEIKRVEGYDIANISGREATGSMVVFTDGFPEKSSYRKFKIETIRQADDVGMLKEVLRRRMRHSEWPLPELALIDGGRTQLNAALATLAEFKISSSKVKIIALAKKEEELYLPRRKNQIKLSSLPPDSAFFLQRVRNEAHRFARAYHHQLRTKQNLNI